MAGTMVSGTCASRETKEEKVVGKEEEKEDIHHERPGGRQGWAGGAQLHS